jgi:hypothetical protein
MNLESGPGSRAPENRAPQIFWRFSRTPRCMLTSSSLFANRESRDMVRQFGRASLIVPPIVSGAAPTLEARVWTTE